MKLGRQNTSKDVAADKSTQAGQKIDLWISWDCPAERLSGKALQTRRFRFKRVMRKRFDAEFAKEMVHHRVADQHDAFQRRTIFFNRDGGEQPVNEMPDLIPDQVFQFILAALSDSKLDTTHHISTVVGLSIQSSSDSQDPAVLKVQQLGHNCSGAQVNGYAKTRPRDKGEA